LFKKIQILEKKTTEAFNSETWLTVPVTVVQEVLKLDQMEASEQEVVAALLRWGKAQVAADAKDVDSDGNKLRQKLDSCVNLVRYNVLKSKEFVDLCQGDLGQVLSWEEKFKVLGCFVQEDWKLMPTHLGPPKPARVKPRANTRKCNCGKCSSSRVYGYL
jgi:hypothetical protein